VTSRSRVTNRTTTEYSILRVDKSAGRWEAVPTSLINDARLGFDTRGFAAWLLARPEGWEIRAGALPHLLKSGSGHVGRDRVRRFLRELERAAYLTRTRRREADGRWIWDYAFRPTSPISTIDALSVGGSPVAGSTVDGKGVDVTHTLKTSRLDQSILNKATNYNTAAQSGLGCSSRRFRGSPKPGLLDARPLGVGAKVDCAVPSGTQASGTRRTRRDVCPRCRPASRRTAQSAHRASQGGPVRA
jgi:hypothetical protein